MIRLPRLTTAAERAEAEAQRIEAAESFALLRALDAGSGQKAELVAAGIPRHTINSLYPETEFAAIASQLILRLPQLDESAWYSTSQPQPGGCGRSFYHWSWRARCPGSPAR